MLTKSWKDPFSQRPVPIQDAMFVRFEGTEQTTGCTVLTVPDLSNLQPN